MDNHKITLKGLMADREITIVELAAYLKMSRATLSRKISRDTLTGREMKKIISFFNINDVSLWFDIFLSSPSQFRDDLNGAENE